MKNWGSCLLPTASAVEPLRAGAAIALQASPSGNPASRHRCLFFLSSLRSLLALVLASDLLGQPLPSGNAPPEGTVNSAVILLGRIDSLLEQARSSLVE